MVPGEFGHIPEHREVTGTPWKVYGPYWAIVGEKRGRPRRRRAPLKPNPNWVGGASFPSPSLPLPSTPSPTRDGGRILLLVGVGLPMRRAIGGPTLPLLHSFIYGGGGTPWTHKLIIDL